MPQAESIVQEMYDWYEARVDDEELHVVFRHLQNTLFKNVTVQLQEDVWKHPDDGGASQLAAKGEAHLVLSGADCDRLALLGTVHLRRPCRFLSVVKPATLLSSPFISLPLYLCKQLLGDVPQLAVEVGC